MKKYLTLRQVGTLSFPLLLGLIVGVVLKEDFSYIESLPRTIKVPSIVFPIVWTILYILALLDVVILIALVGYLFANGWRNKKKYSYLLIPYLLWLFVALSLMLDIISH